MTHMATYDQDRASAFEARMVGALNAGALCLMTSIGHRTGLFDRMAGLHHATSAEIAAASGLHERYVREWLGAMVTAGVIEHDGAARTYRLPAEHAAYLTRASAVNMSVGAQFLPLLGSVEDDIVQCFHQGGGVSYDRFHRFHEVMAEESGQTVLPALREHILTLVPGLTARLEHGIRVLDLGCGRGRAIAEMASWYPRSTFTGLDLSEEAIAWAREHAGRRALDNIVFERRDLRRFDAEAEPAAYDLVLTFDAIHDQPDPAVLLRGIRRTVKDDGVYLAQDIKGSCHVHNNVDHPLGTYLYTVSCMHCMTVSMAQGGVGLGAMWGCETAEAMLLEAGFRDVETRELEHDVINYYYVVRP